MKIRLLSDIHQEFYEDKALYASQGEDVLVLAGDINVGYDNVWSALKRFADNVEHVVYVPGNHEYYRNDILQFDQYIKRFSQGTNIHFLNPGTVRINDVTFIGATGWTNFRKDRIAKLACAQRINDFRLIKGFSGDYCDMLSTEHFKYIFEAYALTEGKKVIVTHFLPAIECIDAEYQGPDLINYYFANDYGNQIGDMQDTTWLFGHTHSLVDLKLGDTRMIANPYGYNRNPNYIEKIIEV